MKLALTCGIHPHVSTLLQAAWFTGIAEKQNYSGLENQILKKLGHGDNTQKLKKKMFSGSPSTSRHIRRLAASESQ